MSARHKSRLMYQRVATHLMRTHVVQEKGYYGRFIVTLFRKAAKEVCLPHEQWLASGETDSPFASVLGIINPSDGHPQEEHTPDFGWFRPLAHNNPTWVLYWPELEV